jgi:hypothetical protein
MTTSFQVALRAGAEGLYTLEAGTGLIIAHGTWAERCDFGSFIHHGAGIAAIDWEAVITALDAGMLPGSGGEKRMLRLAASLAGDIPVRLGDAVTGIDERNVALLVDAVLHASGRRQFPRLPTALPSGFLLSLLLGVEGSGLLGRPTCMRLSDARHQGWAELGTGLVAHAASWPVACMMVAALLALLGYRLAAEKARRRTLTEACAYAPTGTVIVQKSGPGGPAMWVWIGDGQRPGPQQGAAVVVLPAGRRRRPQAAGSRGGQGAW